MPQNLKLECEQVRFPSETIQVSITFNVTILNNQDEGISNLLIYLINAMGSGDQTALYLATYYNKEKSLELLLSTISQKAIIDTKQDINALCKEVRKVSEQIVRSLEYKISFEEVLTVFISLKESVRIEYLIAEYCKPILFSLEKDIIKIVYEYALGSHFNAIVSNSILQLYQGFAIPIINFSMRGEKIKRGELDSEDKGDALGDNTNSIKRKKLESDDGDENNVVESTSDIPYEKQPLNLHVLGALEGEIQYPSSYELYTVLEHLSS